MDTLMDSHTDRQMQTDFIICPMLHAIAMGQVVIILVTGCIVEQLFIVCHMMF